MKVLDVYRAQYFIACLENEIKRAEDSLSHITCLSTSLHELLAEFSNDLLIELDQLLLPTVVHEIHKAKLLGLLRGETSRERYVSFFVDDDGYTEHAKNIVIQYPLLFELTDNLIRHTFDALILCLSRYWNDIASIRQWLQFSETEISKIVPLSSSDRHRNQQSILICLSSGRKLIYKPVDLSPDCLFSAFVTKLELEVPYDIKTLNVLSKDNYGWMEFIHQQTCNASLEVKNFYRRAGVLLAIADALNYTDGHCENLIANGEFPILIDNETLFQNYERDVAQQKNILSTLLIQKVTDDSPFLNSAFQAAHGIKLEYLQTHAVNDQTDEIEIRYFGVNPSKHHHCPILGDTPCSAKDYIPEIIDGFQYAYEKISNKADEIIQDSVWWEQVGNAQSRIVIRETMTYMYLLRSILQPENLSRESSRSFLRQKLGNTTYTDYEVSDLLSLNIPYFYHLPGKRHLYGGKDQKYDNAFKEVATEVMKRHFKERSKEKKQFDCEIIRRHLTSS